VSLHGAAFSIDCYASFTKDSRICACVSLIFLRIYCSIHDMQPSTLFLPRRLPEQQAMGSRTRRTKFRGIVIARRNKGYASTVTLRNVIQGTAIERIIPLYSPHLIDLRIVEKRKARRAKLYYLRDKEIRYSKA